ncbi:Cytochrome b561 and DOMON domain-containing protein [Psilocybe cubensis]|uniref:Cytochrome b561 domain-containing protein n=2 Tax=Psilocybe cubensis TaxID=181762 RepID=A0A8H8CK46_PSICU|nr:Cytochrome b561 and DOMON domain-containing protein [Psilocybe cubensis]KAH9478767.1 Cytochrome b561 and DOMON domain-containing protein [Psilocybe cubensis]
MPRCLPCCCGLHTSSTPQVYVPTHVMHGRDNGGGGGGGGGDAGDAGDGGNGGFIPFSIPLTELERRARNHAILCVVGFLILLPIGALVARYSRTLRYKWFWAHWIIQFLIAGPVIFTGWALGYKTTNELETPHFTDPHQKVGLALLILYVVQMALGAIVHFFKLPSIFRGHRPPHSYLHVLVGLAIFILAQWQVHYGLFTEWLLTGGLHQVPESAKHAWLALVIVFWVLYGLGMALLPRQFKQESQARKVRKEDPNSTNTSA